MPSSKGVVDEERAPVDLALALALDLILSLFLSLFFYQRALCNSSATKDCRIQCITIFMTTPNSCARVDVQAKGLGGAAISTIDYYSCTRPRNDERNAATKSENFIERDRDRSNRKGLRARWNLEGARERDS